MNSTTHSRVHGFRVVMVVMGYSEDDTAHTIVQLVRVVTTTI